MFANLTTEVVSFAEIGKWVAVFAVMLGIYLKLRKWERGLAGQGEKREVSPVPLPVELARRFVDVDHFEREITRIDKDVVSLGSKLDKFRDDITEEGSRRASTIHQRVDKIAEGQAAVAAKQEQTHGALVLLGQKVDALIMELRKDGRSGR